MVRISAVSYLNTKPFIYGLLRSALRDKIDIQLDIPSECAKKLQAKSVELALTPVAVLPELEEWHLVSDYCIGADGKVDTVSIFSEVPIEEVEAVYLDFHSRTSAALTQILFRDFWKKKPLFLPSTEGYFERIQGTTAGLIIGDRAIGQEQYFPYVYDLAEEWKKWTGLPFVFAAWVSPRPLPQVFIDNFNGALAAGLELIPELIKIIPAVADFDIESYFRNAISYNLNAPKKEALAKFLKLIETYEVANLNS